MSDTVTRRTFLGTGAAVTGATLAGGTLSSLLSACGGGSTSATSGGAAGASTAGGDAATLQVAVASDVQGLDPHKAFFPASTEMVSNLFQPLGAPRIDVRDGQRVGDWIAAEPGLASAIELSRDRRRLRVEIPKGGEFPSGNPLTMADVEYTFRRLAHVGIGSFIYSTSSIDPRRGVRRTGPRTLEITASGPVPYLAAQLCQPYLGVYDSRLMEQHASAGDRWSERWAARNSAGGGAYTLADVRHGVGATLEANARYGGERPAFERVELRVIPSIADRAALLQRGGVDFAENISKQYVNQLRGDGDVQILSFPSIEQVYLGMNPNRGPFADKRLRQAVTWALPYDEIVENVYFGLARRMPGMIPVDTPTFDATLPYPEHDPERAQALAKASGAGAVKLKLSFDSAQPEHQSLAAIVQSALAPLEIEVELEPLQTSAFAAGKTARSLPFYIDQILFWINDPSYIADIFMSSRGIVNGVGYANPEVDALIEQGKATVDAAVRERVYGELQRIVLEDAPWAPLVHPTYDVAMSRRLSGYVLLPSHLSDWSRLSAAA